LFDRFLKGLSGGGEKGPWLGTYSNGGKDDYRETDSRERTGPWGKTDMNTSVHHLLWGDKRGEETKIGKTRGAEVKGGA